MPRLSLVSILALCVSALMVGSTGALPTQNDCVKTVNQVGDVSREIDVLPSGGSFAPGNTLVLTDPIILLRSAQTGIPNTATSGKEVYNLGVTLAPTGCAGSTGSLSNVHIQLGLYTLSTGGMYSLVTRTNDIPVSYSIASGGGRVSANVVYNPLQESIAPGVAYYIGFATTSSAVCLYGANGGDADSAAPFTYDPSSVNPLVNTIPASFPTSNSDSKPDFEADALVCVNGQIIGDPVFTGFHGQQFIVKGEADAVFNLISSPDLSFNNRFVSLQSDAESMNSAAMKKVRAQAKHSKLLDLVNEPTSRPPVTTAWNHPGTYMGESGLTLGESKLYIAPGAYATGFSAVTLDGKDLPISSTPVELDGDMTVTRPSAFKVLISTPTVRFSVVNADHFVNIEHAKVLSADAQLTGLLGQTADAEWEVVQSADFNQHIENDYKVASNELF